MDDTSKTPESAEEAPLVISLEEFRRDPAEALGLVGSRMVVITGPEGQTELSISRPDLTDEDLADWR